MKIHIKTPSRLHFTLIDENGSLGRVDGGIGLAISEPNFEIIVYDRYSIINGEELNILEKHQNDLNKNEIKNSIIFNTEFGNILISILNGDPKEWSIILHTIKDISINFIKNLKIYLSNKDFKINNNWLDKFPLKIELLGYLLPHIGFGSKTQMSLAIGTAISKLIEIDLDIITLTELLGRGGTSGIGFRAFEYGGFIFDCGHRFGINKEKNTFLPSSASKAKPARTILRYDFPEDWDILIIGLNVPAGASNIEEINIFQKYCPISLNEVEKVSHLIITKVLPGIIEKDLDEFGYGINQIQKLGFKKIEVQLQHEKVKQLMNDLLYYGSKCVGMSSFGPIIYSIYDNKDVLENSLNKIKGKYNSIGFKYYITKANNMGAKIEIIK